MFRMWVSAVMVISLSAVVSAQPAPPSTCTFGDMNVPCTIEMDASGSTQVTLEPLPKTDWAFLETDMSRVATALHAELLNDANWEKATRYVISQIYRQYRANKVKDLVTYIYWQLMTQMQEKHGTLDRDAFHEAIVLEAGLPVIQVPKMADRITHQDIQNLFGGQLTQEQRAMMNIFLEQRKGSPREK